MNCVQASNSGSVIECDAIHTHTGNYHACMVFHCNVARDRFSQCVASLSVTIMADNIIDTDRNLICVPSASFLDDNEDGQHHA